MPARIVVAEGEGQGRSHGIEDVVVRIGSDASCDLALADPSVPAHALTLEYTNGAYRVYNRSAQPIDIEGREVPPGGTASWPRNALLRLSDRMAIRLEYEGDNAPSPATSLPDLPEESWQTAEDAATSTPTKRAGSRSAMQLVITLVCVLGAAIVLLTKGRDASESTPASQTSQPPPALQELIETISADESAYAPTLQAILRDVQDARSAELRQDRTRARDLYGRARDRLLFWRDPQRGAFPSPPFDGLHEYVKARLESLYREAETQPDALAS